MFRIVGFNTIQETLKALLPFNASNLLLEEIVMQSSFIQFHGVGECLFKKGDSPLGFYFILHGKAEILIPRSESIKLVSGQMVGLDAFLEEERLIFDVVSSSPHLDSIFIDRRCYEFMISHASFKKFIDQSLLRYVGAYRQLLVPSSSMFL
tara:strand:- start:40038 stop:40490 length:453 start_codon:yes stop_codon:yes gene_type:complete